MFNPDFEDIELRRTSLYNQRLVAVNIDELAEAGFYSNGYGHTVNCFHCGVVLHITDPIDNYWALHAEDSPRCEFLIATKGQDYIDEIQNYDSELSSFSSDDDYTTVILHNFRMTPIVNIGTAMIIDLSPELTPEEVDNLDDRLLCKICLNNIIGIALNCGHQLCIRCSNQQRNCHICREVIINKLRIFFN